MTQQQLIDLRDAAELAGDRRTRDLAWVALGHHRHPAFLPATDQERAEALAELVGVALGRVGGQ